MNGIAVLEGQKSLGLVDNNAPTDARDIVGREREHAVGINAKVPEHVRMYTGVGRAGVYHKRGQMLETQLWQNEGALQPEAAIGSAKRAVEHLDD